MATYKTPGVYVEEISTLPPSVAEVATAIPAFIGYTQKIPTVTDTFRVNKTTEESLEFTLSGQPIPGVFTDSVSNLFQARDKNAEAITASAYNDSTRKITIDVKNIPNGEAFTVTYPVLQPTRIGSMLEYKTIFGGAFPSAFDIPIHHDQQSGTMSPGEPARKGKDFLMYYCMSLYFSNGGGPCYIISVGNYDQTLNTAAFEAGLQALSKEDEPTLILLTDAVNLGATDYYSICQQALTQCADLKDRFAILDVLPNDTNASGFRSGVGNNNLKYGAAYTPYLSSVIPYAYDESQVHLNEIIVENQASVKIGTNGKKMQNSASAGILAVFTGEGDAPKVRISMPTGTTTRVKSPAISFEPSPPDNFDLLHIKLPDGNDPSDTSIPAGASQQAIIKAFEKSVALQASVISSNFFLKAIGNKSTIFNTATSTEGLELKKPASLPTLLNDSLLKNSFTGLYNQAVGALVQQRVNMPPSAAMAGIYASVDRSRGVWKAPANVSVNAVIGPARTITAQDQENLNIDVNSGKSINAIRSFTGKGTLVWGARTLAGNDNEWRYISVRRLFNMIEESLQKSTAFAVFEPNDASTWLKIKAMAESYLFGLWQQGALAGPTPEQAYFVNVGLDKSMTSQDILEGRMIVEVGIAAVRPAEFIVLRFSHQRQEA